MLTTSQLRALVIFLDTERQRVKHTYLQGEHRLRVRQMRRVYERRWRNLTLAMQFIAECAGDRTVPWEDDRAE